MAQLSRLQSLKLNTLTSLVLKITQIGCGFVVPWLILHYYGSSVNGLVNSITQFLSLIAFLELGVGPVLQAALYKPLCYRDNQSICLILKCAQGFYNKIGYILVVYTILLILSFPYITDSQFDIFYTGTLIGAIFISSLAQYFFGIVNVLFLNTAQKGYIVNCTAIITTVASTVVGYVLIKMGQSIQIVKLVSSLFFLLRPVYFWLYVKSHYSISGNVPFVPDAIKQKWNGVIQHIAAIAIDFTPIISLSFFADFRIVSVFSIYNIVLSGLKDLFFSLFGGVWPLMGELYAKKETVKLNKFVCLTDWVAHTGTTLLFSITALTIVPFVNVYSSGVRDVNYCVPIFALLFTLNVALQCYKLLYARLIQIAGRFQETQSRYLISAIIAIVLTVVCVDCFGINGSVVGIVLTLIYQILWMFAYDKHELANILSWHSFVKQAFVDIAIVVLVFLLIQPAFNGVDNYADWIVLAIKVSLVAVCVSLIVNYICYRSHVVYVCQLFLKAFKRT